MKKIEKILNWTADHFIWIFGTLAISELLWLAENHLRKED